MELRPTSHPPLTTSQAKAAFKRLGGRPRISTQKFRELARGAELRERAQKAKEAERRKKIGTQKRVEKEAKERETKRRKLAEESRRGKIFVGSTQFPRSQFRMEQFVQAASMEGKAAKTESALTIALASTTEPWEEDELDDGSFLEILDNCETTNPQQTSNRGSKASTREDSRITSQNILDEFDSGLSTQDFQDVELDFTEWASPNSNTNTAGIHDHPLMPPPLKPFTGLSNFGSPRQPQSATIANSGISKADLDLLALADFELTQRPG
ncbi:MAG: hypothetical protein M1820_007547 [Bogoriella megaspora]|nr:MAG: hypothetical protein M1820_007547 [Bogoriella megaspora]